MRKRRGFCFANFSIAIKRSVVDLRSRRRLHFDVRKMALNRSSIALIKERVMDPKNVMLETYTNYNPAA